MKHLSYLFIFVLMFTLITAAVAQEEKENWQKFSKSLVEMFKSDNDGLKQSAMQHIIQYSNKLDVKDAAFDIYNIYRWHKDVQVRRLALVALYNTNYDWAMNQIVKDIKIETSPALKRQMKYMVKEHFVGQPKSDTNYLASQ